MSARLRASPLADVHQRTGAASWLTLDRMTVVGRVDAADEERLRCIGIADLSHRVRAGCKGPGARAWLESMGLPTPARANEWGVAPDGSLVARLGLTEYLIESGVSTESVERVRAAEPAAQVYPVPRFDAALLLSGERLFDLLKQTCAFDFESLDPAGRSVVLTSMAGVGITALRLEGAGAPRLRLWCDGTYGEYLWRTLAEVATELGGGAVGHDGLVALATSAG